MNPIRNKDQLGNSDRIVKARLYGSVSLKLVTNKLLVLLHMRYTYMHFFVILNLGSNFTYLYIDRCNLERDQRAEFVKIGGEQVDVHAVVLELPAKLCISQSVKCTGHEGNLQGGKATAVVNRVLQKKEFSKLNEGFSRITFCQNEVDVKDAVKTYCSLGPFDSLSSGVFGQKNPYTKVQLGIMKFLKKAGTLNNASDGSKLQCDGNGSQGSASKLECREKDPYSMEIENKNENMEDITHKDSMKKASSGDTSLNDILALAFPSTSTSDFQFDHGKAYDIIVESVKYG